MASDLSNTPEFSVSDLSRALKQTVETSFSHVRVRGELSRITIAKSGHLYSDLKDDNAVLNVICWKGTVTNLSIRPEEGMEVICTGRMTTYPGTSRYQLIIESMELAGEGALLKLLEERRKKLIAEGLFDEAHKKPLPFLPKTIGVVTSPTGAVIRDIIHRVRDRCPCRVLVWPVQVQGTGADMQITNGIEGFNRLRPENRPDVIIVARGGGSLEDLMAFNEENVVRAVFQSSIPVISAVGHETDTTLIDFVSDKRAPTPTGAAEMAVPVLDQLYAGLGDFNVRLGSALRRMIDNATQILRQTSRLLDHPSRLIEGVSQRFDMAGERLNTAYDRMLDHKDRSLHHVASRLQTPNHLINQNEMAKDHLAQRLNKAKDQILPKREDQLSSFARMLEGLSYKNILNRGYAVLKDKDGKVIETVESAESREEIDVTLKDGSLRLYNRIQS